MLELVKQRQPVLDEASSAVAEMHPGLALVWKPGRDLVDCEVIEYRREPFFELRVCGKDEKE